METSDEKRNNIFFEKEKFAFNDYKEETNRLLDMVYVGNEVEKGKNYNFLRKLTNFLESGDTRENFKKLEDFFDENKKN